MQCIKTINGLRKALDIYRKKGKKIGFVPTMGALHQGHMHLVRHAKKSNDICVVSIYVNPKQFGPGEDFKKYPRNLRRDIKILNQENVDIVFIPSDNDIYSNSFLTYVDIEGLTEGLCGQFRPGHFRAVATIVNKLLNIVMPSVMYLGQKDAQQVAVVKAMVRDLNMNVAVKVVDTVREADGLAMSSRNVYLSNEHRQQAIVLYKALREAKALINKGERSCAKVIAGIKRLIEQTEGKIQYIACVDALTLKPLKQIKGEVLLAVAVYFGLTRLIDNILIRIHDAKRKKS